MKQLSLKETVLKSRTLLDCGESNGSANLRLLTAHQQPFKVDQDIPPLVLDEEYDTFKSMADSSSAVNANIQVWAAVFESGLDACRCRRELLGPSLPHDEFVMVPFEMRDAGHDIVIFAIASLWLAVRDNGRYWAYGNENVFSAPDVRMRPDDEIRIVSGSEGFLIPICIRNPENPHMIAHHVLAIARLKGVEDGKLAVTIEIHNSLPDYLNPNLIRKAIKVLVKRSSWIRTLPEGKDMGDIAWSNVKIKVNRPQVPEQPLGSNACGLFVILNAWAAMLGIPVTAAPFRRVLDDDQFLKDAQEVVELALAGCMNSETIQAFIQAYGYAEEQDPEAGEQVPHYNTCRMNFERFSAAIEREVEVDRLALGGSDADLAGALPEDEVRVNFGESRGGVAAVLPKDEERVARQVSGGEVAKRKSTGEQR